jgi:hypothetical protein
MMSRNQRGEERMSNKQQTAMKLYTEEQVREMLEICIDIDLYEHILTFEDILKTQNHIELPSDDAGKEMSYDDGYAEGYKRALELVEWAIGEMKTKNNESDT